MSVELGKVICISDQGEAAARDEVLLSVAADPTHAARRATGPEPRSGHPRRRPGRRRPGGGGVAVPSGSNRLRRPADGGHPLPRLRPLRPQCRPPGAARRRGTLAYLRELGCALVALEETDEGQQIYRDWFAAHGSRSRSCAPTSTSSGRPGHGRRDTHARAPPAGGFDRTRPPRGEARLMNDQPSDPGSITSTSRRPGCRS